MLNRALIVIIAGGLLPLGASLWWIFELFSHFRLQYLAIAVTFLAAAALRRRWRLSLLLAAVMLLNASVLTPYLLPRAGTPASRESLTVLNLNVHGDNPEHETIAAAIRAADAELVALLELTPELETSLDTLAAEYPFRVSSPSSGYFGIALLSRFPLSRARTFELGPATAIDALVDSPSGSVRLLAIHTMPPVSASAAATRNHQLDELANLLQSIEEPLVVCGDFNLSPYSPFFARFEDASATTDVRRGGWPGISWPTSMPLLGVPIDHCFIRGPWNVSSVERMAPVGSDHYPVRVTLIRSGTQ